jgi:hypothetical protein
MATSSNVQTYAAAQIFYSAGNTGLQILQQIFIADTSNLLNRALWSSMPDTPFLITVWIGSIIGSAIYKNTTWRWGYGIWCIILPAAFLPLAFTLFSNNRKAKKLGLTAPSQWKGLGIDQFLTKLWSEIDIGGIVLLSAGFALILIPLTIAGKASDGWKSGSIIAMLVIGILCLVIFPFWESNTKLAPRPLIPLYLLQSRTFCAGCGVGFFYFSKSSFLSSDMWLTLSSGLLPLSPTILLLLPPGCTKPIYHLRRSHNPNLFLHVHHRIHHNLPNNQIHKSLQTMHRRRNFNLHSRHRTHDKIPHPRRSSRADSRNTNLSRDRGRDAECTCSARRSGFNRPPTCCSRNSCVPHLR